jgi:hydrogenase maturation protease
MIRALILACGNAVRGDDGVAMEVVRCLRAGFCDPDTEMDCVSHWAPELADPISRADLVVFVDASARFSPGEVHTEAIAPTPDPPGGLTHSNSPAGLLALSLLLYDKAPERAFLVTIGAQSCEFSDQLSEPVRRAIPAALSEIKAALSGVTQPGGNCRSQAAFQ